MIAKICDACEKVLKEKDVIEAYSVTRYFELCEECNKKFEQIDKEYLENNKKLQEEQKKEFEKYKERLKEIGIDYD